MNLYKVGASSASHMLCDLGCSGERSGQLAVERHELIALGLDRWPRPALSALAVTST